MRLHCQIVNLIFYHFLNSLSPFFPVVLSDSLYKIFFPSFYKLI